MRTMLIAIVCVLLLANVSSACHRPQNPNLGDSGYCKNPGCRCILNMQDAHGNTLLYYMAISGRVEMVKWLLRLGADWTVLNNDGKIPFEGAYAVRHLMWKGRKVWRYSYLDWRWYELTAKPYEDIMEALFDQGAGQGAYKELFEGYFERGIPLSEFPSIRAL